MTEPLVAAAGLTRHFAARGVFRRGKPVQAVNDVTLSVGRGQSVGLVGESGSGKSTVGRLMLGLLPPTAGRITFDGADLVAADRSRMRQLRRRMQLVFQDPYSSLDPRRRIGSQIGDGIAIHEHTPRPQRDERIARLLTQVGLDPDHASRFPHQFSGGQRQRIAIARALATTPDFLVADEPVSALDVSVQAQVLALLAELRSQLGLAMLFISHDLSAVRSVCDHVAVMYLGRIMEEGPTASVFAAPRHPYTMALWSAVPSLDRARRRTRIALTGEPPSPADPPSGCVFRTRCRFAIPECASAIPELRAVAGNAHRSACIRDDIPAQPG
jgi:oligopeptide/dipeptide ABC transporter ATP-binding protein